MIRMTITIDDELVDAVKEISGASTKSEAINAALQDFLRRQRLQRVLARQGKIDLALDQAKLQELRETS